MKTRVFEIKNDPAYGRHAEEVMEMSETPAVGDYLHVPGLTGSEPDVLYHVIRIIRTSKRVPGDELDLLEDDPIAIVVPAEDALAAKLERDAVTEYDRVPGAATDEETE